MLALLILLSAVCIQDEYVAPDEVGQHIGEEIAVKMKARSTRFIKDKDLCFLNSKSNHQDDDNFSVVIRSDGLASFAEKEIADPAEYFKGKIIVVKGKAAEFKGKPQIEVKTADQIEIVEEDSSAAAKTAESSEAAEGDAAKEPSAEGSEKSDKVDGPIKPAPDDDEDGGDDGEDGDGLAN